MLKSQYLRNLNGFEGGDDKEQNNTNDGFVEYDEPETLEDLESLTARLIISFEIFHQIWPYSV